MQSLGAWLGLLGGFLVFMLFISAAQTLDRHVESRWGYRPLAPPNLAFMLIPHGILAAIVLRLVAGGGDAAGVPVWAAAVLASILAGGMFWIIRKRTEARVALAATLAMCAAASVLLASMLFRALAEAPSGDGR